MDDEGYVRITGRTKELLIRGGENIPIVEIENLLAEHASVMHAAIVGYPDERLGERACLFVVPRPGMSLDLAQVQDFLGGRKVAKQYWPERVRVVGELPRTASGKVQRYLLKQLAVS
jgi:cyclohexanecarboxylate-CoA ligase